MTSSSSDALGQFLTSSKADFLADLNADKSLEKWVIATGNEAGDLDSLASALGFAYFSSQLTSTSTSGKRYVPLVLTAHSDLYLRPENVFALSSAGVDPASLLCIDDLPSDKLPTLGANFALVDHNRLLPMFGDQRVEAIIDHHVDEGYAKEAEPRIIRPSGSCASLVAQYFAEQIPSETSVPKGLADLLLSSILIDTGLKSTEDGGKATSDDLSSAAWLLPRSSSSSTVGGWIASSASVVSPSLISTDPTLKALTKTLGTKKLDVEELSGRDLLRRDYKEYLEGEWRYGLSTVPLPLSAWLGKTSLEDKRTTGWALVQDDVRRWMEERELAMACVLTSFDTDKATKKLGLGKHARELVVVVAPDQGQGQDKLMSLFEELPKARELDLGQWRGGEERGGERWRVWQQGNAKATRKVVAPIVQGLIRALL